MAFDKNLGLPYPIDLDIHNKQNFITVYSKQYDKDSRYIVATLYDDGNLYTIPTGATASFGGTKPNTHIIVNTVTIEDNKIYYRLDEQATVADGTYEVEFTIYYNGTTLGSPKFKLFVEKAAVPSGAIVSVDEVNILNNLIIDANASISNANTATSNTNTAIDNAETATENANTATTNANTAKDNAITATTNANNAADLANTKAGLADTAATNANAKATLAQTATTNANTATTNANDAATNANAKATLADNASTNANNIATLLNTETLRIFKPSVTNYADLATTYPTPENGWTVTVTSESVSYRYNGTTSTWINLGYISAVDKANETTLGTVKGGGNVVIETDGALNVPEIGTLANLQTTSKTDLVGAINEINAKPTVSSAIDVTYNNATSGLTSTNVQGAVDEVNEQLATMANKKLARYIEYRLPKTDYLTNNFNKISLYGDSIFASDYNDVLLPTQDQKVLSILKANLDLDINKTVIPTVSDTTNYFAHDASYAYADTTYNSGTGEYTLTHSTDNQPRFMDGLIALDFNYNIEFSFDADTTAMNGCTINGRFALKNDSNTILYSSNLRLSSTVSNSGYTNYKFYLNTSMLKSAYPTGTKLSVGVALNSGTTTSTVKVKNLVVKKSLHIETMDVSSISNISAGITVNQDFQYVFTSTVGETRPRYITQYYDYNLIDGKIIRLRATFDNTGCLNKAFKTRFCIYNGTTLLAELNSSKVEEVAGVYNCDYMVDCTELKTKYPTVTKFGIGAVLEADVSGQVAILQSLQMQIITKGCVVFNDSVDGNTAQLGLDRINNITANAPNITVIGFGTNDIRSGVTFDTYKTNVTNIINQLKAVNCKCLICTIPPLATNQPNYDLVSEWNDEIKYFAATIGVQVFDRWWSFGDGDISYIADGRHPTIVGYKKLADDVYSVLIGNRIS